MLQSVKVDDQNGASQNGSRDESQTNTFGKKRNISLELQNEDGRNGKNKDDDESEEGDREGVEVGQPLDDDVGEGEEESCQGRLHKYFTRSFSAGWFMLILLAHSIKCRAQKLGITSSCRCVYC